MTVLVQFLSREVLFLAILTALGSGPATFLGEKFSCLARIAMAPVLGMCVGTAVFTCTLWFLSADSTYWLVPVICALSLGVAIYHTRSAWLDIRARSRSLLLGLGQIALVVVVVTAPTAYTFYRDSSVGPVTYLAPDAGAYALQTDGMIHESLRLARAQYPGPWHDLVQAYYSQYAAGFQEIDIDPLEANVDAMIAIGATGTQSPFMLSALVAGALGAFAAVLYFLRRRSSVAVLAGALFGAPFSFNSSSTAARVPSAVWLCCCRSPCSQSTQSRNRVSPTALLLALVCSGLMALYPLFVVPVALVGALVLVGIVVSRGRERRISSSWLRRGLSFCIATALVTAAMDPVVLLREHQLLAISQRDFSRRPACVFLADRRASGLVASVTRLLRSGLCRPFPRERSPVRRTLALGRRIGHLRCSYPVPGGLDPDSACHRRRLVGPL